MSSAVKNIFQEVVMPSPGIEMNFRPITSHHFIKATFCRRVRLAAPPCSIGITDGSERGSYVPQSHLLKAIGRPHHIVNLMFQYYPEMENWPTQGVNWHGFYRNNELNKGDGYFPLVLEPGGRWGQAYLRQIEDVRALGQEPQLTLTLLTHTPDEALIRIAESLRPYAPMRIRINHECNGVWFYFNQVSGYREVSDFFIRFHRILHEYAPGIQTVACWNGPGDTIENPETPNPNRGMLTDDQLGPMFRIADIISFDQYASLHYGWPDPAFDAAHPTHYFRVPFERWWQTLEDFHRDISELRGSDTPVEIHEINEDANLTGFEAQAGWITRFYREAARRKLSWLTNITFYQFRDRGGLGLEQEDLHDATRYRALPSLAAYREAIDDPRFALCIEADNDGDSLLWQSPSHAQGVEYFYDVPAETTCALLTGSSRQHLLIEHNGQWTLKPRGIEQFVLTREPGPCGLRIHIFTPPPDGRNNSNNGFASALDEPPMILI